MKNIFDSNKKVYTYMIYIFSNQNYLTYKNIYNSRFFHVSLKTLILQIFLASIANFQIFPGSRFCDNTDTIKKLLVRYLIIIIIIKSYNKKCFV